MSLYTTKIIYISERNVHLNVNIIVTVQNVIKSIVIMEGLRGKRMNVPSFVTSISLKILEECNNIMSIPVTVKTLKIDYDSLITFSKIPDTIENLYLNRFRYTEPSKIKYGLTPYSDCLSKSIVLLIKMFQNSLQDC